MTKAKTLGEYKENLGNKLKDFLGSESLKKEYKGKLFREIVVDPDYQKLKEEYLSEKKSKTEKEALFQEAFLKAKKINPALMEEDFRSVIGIQSDKESVEKNESGEINILDIQKKILSKPNMTEHHKAWLEKRTKELVNEEDEEGLKQLDENIDFSEKGGLIIKTPEGPLKFAPKQASYNDVKDIEGLKEGENIWTENEETKKKGLWANYEAVKKMQDAGKKICTNEQYLAVANAFPGGAKLNGGNKSTKVKDFFDLLGVDQYGFRGTDGGWYYYGRIMWSSSADEHGAYNMRCDDDEGILGRPDEERYAFGVHFLED